MFSVKLKRYQAILVLEWNYNISIVIGMDVVNCVQTDTSDIQFSFSNRIFGFRDERGRRTNSTVICRNGNAYSIESSGSYGNNNVRIRLLKDFIEIEISYISFKIPKITETDESFNKCVGVIEDFLNSIQYI